MLRHHAPKGSGPIAELLHPSYCLRLYERKNKGVAKLYLKLKDNDGGERKLWLGAQPHRISQILSQFPEVSYIDLTDEFKNIVTKGVCSSRAYDVM